MRILAALRAVPLRRLVRSWTDRYRPELHYMRGPGPKCAEARSLRERGRDEGSARGRPGEARGQGRR